MVVRTQLYPPAVELEGRLEVVVLVGFVPNILTVDRRLQGAHLGVILPRKVPELRPGVGKHRLVPIMTQDQLGDIHVTILLRQVERGLPIPVHGIEHNTFI